MHWIDANKDLKIPTNRPLLCYCPAWCYLGYQVAKWDGSKFYYDEDPSGSFNDHVKSWALFIEAD